MTLGWMAWVSARQMSLVVHRGGLIIVLEVLDHEAVVPLVLRLGH